MPTGISPAALSVTTNGAFNRTGFASKVSAPLTVGGAVSEGCAAASRNLIAAKSVNGRLHREPVDVNLQSYPLGDVELDGGRVDLEDTLLLPLRDRRTRDGEESRQ